MATPTEQLQQLYVAYFSRPADVDGLNYWLNALNHGGTIAQVSAAFAVQPEYTNVYGGKQPSEVIDTVYMNLFGRHAEQGGLDYWGSILQDHPELISQIVTAIVAGAKNEDGTPNADGVAYNDKVTAAGLFTDELKVVGNEAERVAYQGGKPAVLDIAKGFIASVTDDVSLATATTNLHTTAQQMVTVSIPVTNFTLTNGVDTFVGGAGNDSFNATGATFTALDSLDGGAGNNVLNVIDASGVMNTTLPAGVSVKNVQTMNVTTVKSLGSVLTAASAGTPAQSEIDKATISGTAGGGETFTVHYGVLTATTASVTTDANASTAVAAAINSLAGSTIATVIGADIIITGAAGVTLPAITVSGATLGPVTVANQQPAAAAVAGTAGSPNAVFDISGIALSTFNGTTTGGENLNAAATTDVNATDTGSNSTTQIAGGKNVTVTESGTAGAVVVDGAAGTTTVNQNTAGNVTIGATTASTGAIVVNDTAQGAGVLSIQGGSTVNVTSASTASTGTITIGNVTKPTGAVTVSESLSGAAGASITGGTITVNGGTTVTVTNSATEAVKTVTAANGTVTESNVVVNGSAATTAVTVNQTATVAAVPTIVAVAGATEVVSEKFVALTGGQSLIVGGLTFTAGAAGTTAAQTAAAFANLANGASQGNSALGTYSGAFTGWSTSAVSGASSDTVVFTNATANSAQLAPVFTGGGTAPTATVVTTGAPATAAQAGVGGITAGTVTVVDSKYNAGTNTITNVTINGYATGSAVSSDALTKLSLANAKDAAVTVNNHTATALDLTLNKVTATVAGVASVLNLDAAAPAKYTSLAVHATGADSAVAVTATGVQALTIDGSKSINLTGSNLAGLKTVAITGTAGVNAGIAFTGAQVSDVNASGTSGAVTATLNAHLASYEGGSGVDTIVLNNVSIDKAISLGAGNDSLTLAAPGALVPTVAVDGGAGVDTLVVLAADAASLSTAGAFASKVTGFEILSLTGGAGTQLVHLDTLGGYNQVSTGGEAASGVLSLDGFSSGGSLTLTSDAAGALATLGQYTVSSTAFTTPTTDVFNIGLTKAGALAGGVVNANSIETINIAATDTSVTASGAAVAPGTNTDTLTLNADSVTKLVITGNANLSLSGANTTLTSVDASGMTGGLTYTTAGTTAETVKGGAGVNVLTAHAGTSADVLIGGAGNDTLVANAGLDTLTGGAGSNTFVIQTASANLNSYATITDAKHGDLIKLVDVGVAGGETFTSAKISLAATAVFQDFANAAVNASGDSSAIGHISWFQFGGDTYVVESKHDATALHDFQNGTDVIVKLSGTVDLSLASLNNGGAPTLLLG